MKNKWQSMTSKKTSQQETFTPKKLRKELRKELREDPQKLQNMTELSSGYFKVACELRDKAHAKEDSVAYHRYVFPAVIMYVSSLEAYFNENLTLSSFAMGDDALKRKISSIKDGDGVYKTFRNRLKEIFKLYDKSNNGIDTNGVDYQNIIALVSLRNSVTHYNPMFIEHVEWPHKLEQVLQRSRIDVINSGWVTNFSSPPIAMWAYETTKSIVQLFCSLSGGIDPFNCDKEYESFRWE